MSQIQIFMFAWWVPLLSESGPCGEVILLQCVIRYQWETNEALVGPSLKSLWFDCEYTMPNSPMTNSPIYWGDNLLYSLHGRAKSGVLCVCVYVFIWLLVHVKALREVFDYLF